MVDKSNWVLVTQLVVETKVQGSKFKVKCFLQTHSLTPQSNTAHHFCILGGSCLEGRTQRKLDMSGTGGGYCGDDTLIKRLPPTRMRT